MPLSSSRPPTVRARRITCRAYQPDERLRRAASARPTNTQMRNGGTPVPTTRIAANLGAWVARHTGLVVILLLVLASCINLPLIVAAATASTAPANTAGSKSGASGAVPLVHPAHVLLISLPWRGHVMPLRHIGARLVARGFQVTLATAGEAAAQWLQGSGISLIAGGNFKACGKIKRQRERQPTFGSTRPSAFNRTQQARLHPGAQLVDPFSAPDFAFQATDHTNASTSQAPNGVTLLMRTYAEFQQCMLKVLMTSVGELMSATSSDAPAAEQKRKSDKKSDRRESDAKESRSKRSSEQQQSGSPPTLVLVDRFTFAGMDVARHYNLTYIVNNPHVLLDLDSPSWALPAPWSYLPAQPPLSLGARVQNLLHRFDYRATMYRSLALVNANRERGGLAPIDSWSAYYERPLILTNTIWGVELHRSADAQGMQSHRNVNVQANGYTPRFRMTGAILPVGNASTLATSDGHLFPGQLMPTYSDSEPTPLFDAKLLQFIARATAAKKSLIYVNLGDGEDLAPSDVSHVVSGLRSLGDQYAAIWSLPKRHARPLTNSSSLLHVEWVSQFQLLSRFRQTFRLVLTHAALGNIQESLAAGLPILLLPHPYVDQFEVASRFARTGAVYMLQRVQITDDTVREAIEKIIADPSYATSALRLSSLFLPSSSSGTSEVCGLLELVARIGWRQWLPLTADPDAPLAFYRDAIYSLPIDIYALYIGVIAILLVTGQQLWAVLAGVWNGPDKRSR